MKQQFKHKTSGELYHIGKDQKQGTNLINSITGSEYFLPGYYEQKDVDELFTPVKETEPAPPPTSKEGLEDAKFTKGEWKARGTTRGLNGFYIGTDTQNIAQVYSSIPECEANARLIAAAPAMFEALKSVLSDLPFQPTKETYDKIEAILTRINKD